MVARRSTTRALLAVLGVAIVGAAVLAIASWTASDRDPHGDTVEVENLDPDRARDYWTEERMREAEPLPMPTVRD